MDSLTHTSARTSSFPLPFIQSAARSVERALLLLWAADRIAQAVSYGHQPDPSDLEIIGAPPSVYPCPRSADCSADDRR